MPQPPEFAEVIALLPCPFCGGEPVVNGKSDYVRVRCETCDVQGQSFDFNSEDFDDVDRGEAAAITAWNTRTPPTPAGYDAGDVATASAEGFRAGVTSVGEWLPIESAPRDGSLVLLYTSVGVVACAWDDGCFGNDCVEYDCATHWQPLPAPPAIAQPSEVGGGL